jgi:hypothetical protein
VVKIELLPADAEPKPAVDVARLEAEVVRRLKNGRTEVDIVGELLAELGYLTPKAGRAAP